jgi:hypothetical protein
MRIRKLIQLAFGYLILLIVHSSVLLAQWEEKAALPDPRVTYAVAIDSMTCFLTVPDAGAGFPGHPLYITRNGGTLWETLMDSVVSIDASDPAFITLLRVHRFWGKDYFRVLQSSDTGRTWQTMTTFRYSSLNGGWGAVYAYSQHRAFIYYNDRFVTVRRRDSIPENSKLKFQVTGCFRRGRIFWFPAETGIWRSDDDGSSLDRALDGQDIEDFFPLDEHTAWALTNDFDLYRTDDAGASWSAIAKPRKRRFRDPLTDFDRYSRIYAPGDTTQPPWLKIIDAHYVRNDDGTWDNLSLPPEQSEGFQSVSRCRDGSAWGTTARSVFKAVGTQHEAQRLTVLDLSSQGMKRANVILPAIGWESWRQAIVERAEAGGEFKVIGSVQSPGFLFTDETCPTAGPFRYRVTYAPPAGKYTQLEAAPITLDRDSVLILDIIEYVRIPEGLTLHYTNGMSMYCSYDSMMTSYTFHKQFADRDTTDGLLVVEQHPQLWIQEFNVTQGALLNGSNEELSDWRFRGPTRFAITSEPPDTRVDTITLKSRGGGGPIGEARYDYSAVLVRNLGIVEMKHSWYSPRTQSSGGSLVQLIRTTGVGVTSELPKKTDIHSAFPNPASDLTTVRMDLGQSGPVQLVLYDVLGRKVATVFDGMLEAGTYDHPLRMDVLPKGMYLIILRTQGMSSMKKLLLQR